MWTGPLNNPFALFVVRRRSLVIASVRSGSVLLTLTERDRRHEYIHTEARCCGSDRGGVDSRHCRRRGGNTESQRPWSARYGRRQRLDQLWELHEHARKLGERAVAVQSGWYCWPALRRQPRDGVGGAQQQSSLHLRVRHCLLPADGSRTLGGPNRSVSNPGDHSGSVEPEWLLVSAS
jgi:hypothetical protein